VDVVDVKRWFLPNSPDLIGLLVRQAEVTIEGLDTFVRWCAGQPDAEAAVGAAEHAADDLRRQLQRELRAAFSTPCSTARRTPCARLACLGSNPTLRSLQWPAISSKGCGTWYAVVKRR
jgi:hypothetical protein